MPVCIHLPDYLTARSAGKSIAACAQAIHAKDDVDIDASALRFVDPFGMALLGAAFFTVQQQGRSVRVCGLNPEIGGYLQRMDVFAGVELVGCASEHVHRRDRTGDLLELTRLENRDQVDKTALRLAQTLIGHIPDIDPNEPPDEMSGYTTFERLVEPIQYAFTELLENALTHARRQGFPNACVWAASQYYPKRGLIRLGVVDNGCGFLATLRGHAALRHERHLEAILAALRPRVSCNRDLGIFDDSVNQGVGLTTTYRIAERAGGRLVIVSGDAMHDTSGHSGVFDGGAYWQGVAIAMECLRERLPYIRLRELLPPIGAQPAVRLRFE